MFVVGAAADGDADACLVGFTSQCSIEPPRFAVFLSKANHTYELASRADDAGRAPRPAGSARPGRALRRHDRGTTIRASSATWPWRAGARRRAGDRRLRLVRGPGRGALRRRRPRRLRAGAVRRGDAGATGSSASRTRATSRPASPPMSRLTHASDPQPLGYVVAPWPSAPSGRFNLADLFEVVVDAAPGSAGAGRGRRAAHVRASSTSAPTGWPTT